MADVKHAPGDTVTTPAGHQCRILAVEPNRLGGPDEFVYKLRSGGKIWRIYASTVDGY